MHQTGRPYWSGNDYARGVAVRSAGGYTLDLYGGVHAWGGAPARSGLPYYPGRDWFRGLHVSDSGPAYAVDRYGGIDAF